MRPCHIRVKAALDAMQKAATEDLREPTASGCSTDSLCDVYFHYAPLTGLWEYIKSLCRSSMSLNHWALYLMYKEHVLVCEAWQTEKKLRGCAAIMPHGDLDPLMHELHLIKSRAKLPYESVRKVVDQMNMNGNDSEYNVIHNNCQHWVNKLLQRLKTIDPCLRDCDIRTSVSGVASEANVKWYVPEWNMERLTSGGDTDASPPTVQEPTTDGLAVAPDDSGR
ncbi:uncharacterized protein LOC135368567 [Ornithodoros turicata]|uniref:uncharacterized protein LOC135368567 n=1 Tax=Ornithodoros turicata TaxID=34597 RepID=UPI0031395383